ncbi:MAG: YdcF family protein [Pseudomonadota bacterium]
MIWRVLGAVVLAWGLGFAAFMLSLGRPLSDTRGTDAIVVLTGGSGRIDRGLALMKKRLARRMLVTGVDPDVKPRELAAEYRADPRLFACCIDLGHQAVDTRGNAEETAEWVRAHHYASVRLVTSDWHMPRARMELRHVLGADVELLGDPVPTRPRFATLMSEYHKFLVRGLVILLGAG